MNTYELDKTTKATEILQEYIPTFFNSENYKWNILQVILDNQNWVNRLIDFVDTHEEDSTIITQTIMHDIGGLMKNDEHFLPRI
mgnify:CR=1 FL=1